MKRFAFKLLVFLLLGAIINVAVAWGCALFLKPDMESWRLNEVFDPSLRLYITGNVSKRPGISVWNCSRDVQPTQDVEGVGKALPRWIIHRIRSESDGDGILLLAAGWPFQSLECQFLVFGTPPKELRFKGAIDTNLTPWDYYSVIQMPRGLPYRPIWPGFAINTIFYAAIVWTLLAVQGAVRRRVRIRRGQCASCGYSLRGTPGTVCPECGATA